MLILNFAVLLVVAPGYSSSSWLFTLGMYEYACYPNVFKTRWSARDTCRQNHDLSSNIVSLSNRTQFDELRQFLYNNNSFSSYQSLSIEYWIYATRSNVDGGYTWRDGKTVDSDLWWYEDSDQDCAVLVTHSSELVLNTVDCSELKTPLCQREITLAAQTTTAAAPNQQQASLVWVKIDGSKYGVSVNSMNSSDAYNLCHSFGPDIRLAILDTIPEFTAVTNFLLSDFRYRNSEFWVSARSTADSHYVWTNTAKIKESFWSSGEPRGFADCVALALATFPSWISHSMSLKTELCNNNRTFALCQVFAAETGTTIEAIHWVNVNSQQFGISNKLMNFSEAYELCRSQGANVRLAILDTSQAYDAVTQNWRAEFFWVGARETNAGQFEWTNGAAVEGLVGGLLFFGLSLGCLGLDTTGGMMMTSSLEKEDCGARHYALCQRMFLQTEPTTTGTTSANIADMSDTTETMTTTLVLKQSESTSNGREKFVSEVLLPTNGGFYTAQESTASMTLDTTKISTKSSTETTNDPEESFSTTTLHSGTTEVTTNSHSGTTEVSTKPPSGTTEVSTKSPSETTDILTKSPSGTTEVSTKSPSETTELTTKPPWKTTEVSAKPLSETTEVTAKPPSKTTEVSTKPLSKTTEVTTKPPSGTTEVIRKSSSEASEVTNTTETTSQTTSQPRRLISASDAIPAIPAIPTIPVIPALPARRSPAFCPCHCRRRKLGTPNSTRALGRQLRQIVEELTVDSNQLSSVTRRRTCARDSRPSSVASGSLAVAVLVLVALVMVGFDVIGLVMLWGRRTEECPRSVKS